MFITIIPEFYLFFSLTYILILGVVKTNVLKDLNIPNLYSWLSSFVLFISFLLIISEPEKIELAFNGSLISDAFSNVTKTVIVVSSIVCLLISKDFLTKKKINAFEYFVIFLFSVLGLLLLASSFDLLTLYLALEIQSFSFYILASFKRDDSYSTEAGLKYFLLGAIASGMLLFGCSLVYGFAGSIHFENLSKIFIGSIEFSNESFFGVVIALLFINVALLFKLGIAPFHSWLPDVYEGSLVSVTTIFSVVPYLALFTIFLRINYVVFLSLSSTYQIVFLICSLLSILIGSFSALVQRKIKRFFAFSTIGNLGFVFLAMSSNSIEGFKAAILYLLIYLITTLGVWSILNVTTIKNSFLIDYSGLYRANLALGFSFAIILFSMAGVPPLAGFFAKLFVFLSAISENLYVFAILSILISCVSSFYYIRIVKIVFFENSLKWVQLDDIGRLNSLVLAISTIILVIFVFEPSVIQNIIHKMVLSLYI